MSWTLSPNVGTISSTGLYTAPATLTTQQSVVVTATSVADTTKSASASLTLGVSTPAFVQQNSNKITRGTTNRVAFPFANTAGDLIVAYVIWDNSGSVSLSDSKGNVYMSAVGPTKWSGDRTNAQIFYAKNIAGGANTVTVRFSTGITSWGVLCIHEYSGIDTASPLDAVAAATGSGSAMSSGPVWTTNATDLLFGAGESTKVVTRVGTGYTSRSTISGNITEDRSVTAAGSYKATATHNGTGWIMQMVAFKAAGSGATAQSLPPLSINSFTATHVSIPAVIVSPDTHGPTVPADLTATSKSRSTIDLSWTESSDNIGVSGYKIFRNGAQVGTSVTNSYSDTGLPASTTYTYNVSAYDAEGNVSAISTSAFATTQAQSSTSISTYSTAFPLSENLVSESGNWFNGGKDGLSWTNVRTNRGLPLARNRAPPWIEPV